MSFSICFLLRLPWVEERDETYVGGGGLMSGLPGLTIQSLNLFIMGLSLSISEMGRLVIKMKSGGAFLMPSRLMCP